LMSDTPSSPLPLGPLVRTLLFFVTAAAFVSLAGRHKAEGEIMTSVVHVGGQVRNDEAAKVRGGLHELVIDPTHPAVSHDTAAAMCRARASCFLPEMG
jgi:hypothetical protein